MPCGPLCERKKSFKKTKKIFTSRFPALAWPHRCSVSIVRTVPLAARITMLCVLPRPPPSNLTPRSKSPSETPVAAKKTSSPPQRSSVNRILERSYPSAKALSRSPNSSRGASRPWMDPPRHLRAAAATTPSGVPPIPSITSTGLPGRAVSIAPATSPSEIRRMRAPVARTWRMSSACRGRSRMQTFGLGFFWQFGEGAKR